MGPGQALRAFRDDAGRVWAGHLGHPRRDPGPENVAEVVWTGPALASLETIRLYIGAFNPLAAQRMALRLLAAGVSAWRNTPSVAAPLTRPMATSEKGA